MPRAEINGTELYFAQQGTGEPIIFHHGYTGSHDTWPGIIERLRDRFHCIMMDSRGAGDSAHPEDGYTIEQYARDVVAMADHLELERFTYVGHSMGGVIGMQLGLAHAERLNRLVLVAPAPSGGIQETEQMRAMQERNRRIREAGDRETMVRERMLTSARPNEATIGKAVDRALSVSQGHLDQSWEALRDARLDLTQLTTATLVIAGAADGLLQANLTDFMALPNATLHVFSRVSHGVPTEVTEEFAAVVGDFMEHGVVTAATLQAKLQESLAAAAAAG